MLENLTNEQLDQVYDWLLEMPTKQVVEKVALPAPEGFGIQTHVTTLRRFKEKRWAELAADRIQAATQLAGITASQHDTLETGIQVAIKHHMFQRVSSPNITDDQLAIVSRWSHRQEKLKLEIQRVQIARERCAQNNLRLQLLTSRRLNPTLNLNPNRFTGRDAERVSAQVNISSGVFHPSPTSIPGNFLTLHAQPSANTPSPLPSLPSVNGTPASPSQSDIRDQKSDLDSRSEQHLRGNKLEADLGGQIPSADSATSALNSDSDRPCDHLGPLARNWEDIRKRAQIKFGITPEESARRAELRRTWKNPNSDEVGTLVSNGPSSSPSSSPKNSDDASDSKLNVFVLLKEITDSVKAAGGHLPPPPPEPETTASSPNQPSLATQVVQAPRST